MGSGLTLDVSTVISIIAVLGLLSGIGLGVKAWYERRTLHAKAGSDEANATTLLVAAARELVDPLRQELSRERVEHAKELDLVVQKEAEVRAQLSAALVDVGRLREELAAALAQAERAQALVRAYEEENQRLRALLTKPE